VENKFWNKGIATEAIKQIIKFGFSRLKLTKIWAGTIINNPASGRALEKAGFKHKKIKNKYSNWQITI